MNNRRRNNQRKLWYRKLAANETAMKSVAMWRRKWRRRKRRRKPSEISIGLAYEEIENGNRRRKLIAAENERK